MKKFIPLLILIALTGCASHETKQQVNAQAQKSTVTGPEKFSKTIQETIQSSEFLTKKQKAELEEILRQNKKRADDLTAESFKFRSVLIKELLSPNVDQKKIKVIKSQIKKIEDDKLKNTFEAIEKISSVVGKNKDREAFSQGLIYLDRR